MNIGRKNRTSKMGHTAYIYIELIAVYNENERRLQFVLLTLQVKGLLFRNTLFIIGQGLNQ